MGPGSAALQAAPGKAPQHGKQYEQYEQHAKQYEQRMPTDMDVGGWTPSCHNADGGQTTGPQGYRPRNARVMDDGGKVRKVSGKLFQEPSR